MDRTRGRGDGKRHGTQRDGQSGQDERQRAAEREASDHARETGYQPSVNQRRHEPMPASRHDDLRQEAVIRNEEHARDSERAQPSPQAPSRGGEQRTGRGDRD